MKRRDTSATDSPSTQPAALPREGSPESPMSDKAEGFKG